MRQNPSDGSPEGSLGRASSILLVVLVMLGTGAACHSVAEPALEQQLERLCVARSADGEELRCPAPSGAVPGSRCSCVEGDTLSQYLGRVRDVGP